MLRNVTPEACVAFALETEEKGAAHYEALAKRFGADGELRELFEGLARDEVHHGEQIRSLAERLAPRLRERKLSAEEQDYLRAMSLDFLDAEAGDIRSREDALRSALHLEKSTLAWYRALRDLVGPEEVLDALVAMERKHVLQVTGRLVTEVIVHGLGESA